MLPIGPIHTFPVDADELDVVMESSCCSRLISGFTSTAPFHAVALPVDAGFKFVSASLACPPIQGRAFLVVPKGVEWLTVDDDQFVVRITCWIVLAGIGANLAETPVQYARLKLFR